MASPGWSGKIPGSVAGKVYKARAREAAINVPLPLIQQQPLGITNLPCKKLQLIPVRSLLRENRMSRQF